MKNDNRSDIKRTMIFITVGLLVSMMLFTVFSRVVTGISAAMTYETTLAVKKNMLYENVNNMIIYLEGEREQYLKDHPGASEAEVEEEITALARKRIYEEEHSDGAYMWVQKVLDYNGGDDYAVRLIHPNLSDTEGCFLSTNEVNQMGMKAYEIELNGIRSDGEIYQNYAFKKLNSDEVTEKVSYARLYEPFDWIICMGVNLDDIDHYRLQAQEHMRTYEIIVLLAIVFTWLVMLLAMVIIYRKTRLREYEKRNQELKDKLDRDELTGARSRACGERLLSAEHEAFLKGKENTLIMMMDVDRFKNINDGYGHDTGDKVLQAFVGAVRETFRASDSIIRWGGDEFIVLLQDIAPETVRLVADKILDSVRGINLEGIMEDYQITSSVGITYFDKEDTDYNSALIRADEALYRAKEDGRNNWKMS
ncbi:MAG: diguanylate cyclase [Lachnospiraceae bacterium]|nr:diguanylate cyclase [Lachnospiraceae bacterium]